MKVVDDELTEGKMEIPEVRHYDDLTPEARRIRALLEHHQEASRKGGLATAAKPAPKDCRHCQMMGYTSWMQHIGHLGFAAMLLKSPSAAHIVRAKIKHYPLPEPPEPEIPF